MSGEELAAVLAALNAYAAQPDEPAQPVSKWKMEARREAVSYDVR
jgi:hypothetical protein